MHISVNPPMTPQKEGSGARLPNCKVPDKILFARPVICAVAADVVATNATPAKIKIFITC